MESVKELPNSDVFYSHLYEEFVTVEEYKFAKKVWKIFKCNNLVDYCLAYCRSDTLLLAEIFQKFRKTMYKFVNLDPTYFISLPSFAWQAMLKLTGVTLECMTDIDQTLFCEEGIRGGLSFIGDRYYKADEHQNIYYIDANVSKYILKYNLLLYTYIFFQNLYGHCQTMKLPVGDFKWIDPKSIKNPNEFIDNIPFDGSKGYLFECDLTYPPSIHKKHRNFPLAPHNVQVQYKDLSPYAKEALHINGGGKTYKCDKLIASFLPKKKYVLHYKNLKLYLKLGLKLKRLNKILEFRQDDFLKKYIEACTLRRQQALNKFEKELYKLLCNAGTYAKMKLFISYCLLCIF